MTPRAKMASPAPMRIPSQDQGSGDTDDANEGPDVPITGDTLDQASAAPKGVDALIRQRCI